jgi:integrase/recombinase XerD
MTKLRQRMIEDMRLRNFSLNTQKAYATAVADFARHFAKSPDELSVAQVREFLLYLVQEQHASYSRYNIARCALHFFWRVTLGREDRFDGVPCAKNRKRLPVVLSQEEVQRFFAVCRNLRHRALFMTLYGAGLRASELEGLRPGDIDSARMVIRIRQGKGQKDRYAKLSAHLLATLRDYYKRYKPREWLFPSLMRKGSPLHPNAITALARIIAKRAGLQKVVTAHTFRHSYATHMLDAGADLRTIQVLLGHRSISSTAIYMHVSQAKIDAAPSPLDRMYAPPRQA